MGYYRSPDGGETWSVYQSDEELEAEHQAFEAKCAAELPGLIERGRKLADVEQKERLPDEIGCSVESYRCRRVAMIAHDIVCHVARVNGLATMTESIIDHHIQQGQWVVRAEYDKWGYGSKAHARAAVVATEAIKASLFDPRGVLWAPLNTSTTGTVPTTRRAPSSIASRRRLSRRFDPRPSGRNSSTTSTWPGEASNRNRYGCSSGWPGDSRSALIR